MPSQVVAMAEFRRGQGQSYRASRTEYTGSLRKLQQIRKDMGKFPQDLTRKLRPVLRESGQEPLAEIKKDAAWSRRIPGATRLSVTFTSRFTGVSIVTDRKKAPHARPFEHGGNPGQFRHRVFGKDVWVYEPARPFMGPTAKKWFDGMDEKIGQVIDEVITPYGFD